MLALLLIAAPLVCEAQQAISVPRIAVLLFSAPPPVGPNFAEPFSEGLQALGYVEGRNIAIEYRYADGKSDRLGELAAELVRMKVDIIVAAFTPAEHRRGRPEGFQASRAPLPAA
jgi:putative ABC transport system substrate-binding protein